MPVIGRVSREQEVWLDSNLSLLEFLYPDEKGFLSKIKRLKGAPFGEQVCYCMVNDMCGDMIKLCLEVAESVEWSVEDGVTKVSMLTQGFAYMSSLIPGSEDEFIYKVSKAKRLGALEVDFGEEGEEPPEEMRGVHE